MGNEKSRTHANHPVGKGTFIKYISLLISSMIKKKTKGRKKERKKYYEKERKNIFDIFLFKGWFT